MEMLIFSRDKAVSCTLASKLNNIGRSRFTLDLK